jgi:hypothetical protein
MVFIYIKVFIKLDFKAMEKRMKSLKLAILFFNSILFGSFMHAVQPALDQNESAPNICPKEGSAFDKDMDELYKELSLMSAEELESFMDQILVDQKTSDTIESEAALSAPELPVEKAK